MRGRKRGGRLAVSRPGCARPGGPGASTARGTGRVIRRLTQASGAGRTGLDRVIELTAAGAAADAFVAVALAGTLFFSTSVDQARGRIALTLLITMAPFAVLAPFIGPMLDRVRDGRRYIMVGTLLARGLLCWGMAGAVQHSDTVTLLPAAFGVLVLQKAYGVTRSAVTPRVLPAKITLVSANARISLASLIASTVGVGVAGGVSFLAGGGTTGATWALRVGTLVYLAAIALGIRLPTRVDQQDAQAAAPAGPAARRRDRRDRGRSRSRSRRGRSRPRGSGPGPPCPGPGPGPGRAGRRRGRAAGARARAGRAAGGDVRAGRGQAWWGRAGPVRRRSAGDRGGPPAGPVGHHPAQRGPGRG